jgi:hypothetical protein
MLRRALRTVLFTIVTIVLWTVSRPAMAMPAGYCDDRGASAIAPAPTLEAPDVAIQRARTEPSCDVDELLAGAAASSSHSHPRITTAAPDSAVPTAGFELAPPSRELLSTTLESPLRADGVTSGIERPPRR